MGQLLPAMTQQKLDTQRDVVKNERRWSVDNQPYGTAWESSRKSRSRRGTRSTIRFIGSMEDLSAASLDDIASFFATYYTPDNAVLSIAGDIDLGHGAATGLEQYFGAIPRGAGRPPLGPMAVSPQFESPKREIVPDRRPPPAAVSRVSHAGRFGSEGYYVASVWWRGARIAAREPPASDAGPRAPGRAADATAFTSDLAKGSDILVADCHGTARHFSRSSSKRKSLAWWNQLWHSGVTEAEVRRAVALIETAYTAALQEAAERADKLSQFATVFR